MSWRRWLFHGFLVLAAVAPEPARAQQLELNYAPHTSDTGFAGQVSLSGGYGAVVPLDLPGARGDLPVPVQVRYTERGFGAAGLGWDVPLSFIRRDGTIARQRPVGTPGAIPQPRAQLSLHLAGQRMDLVRTATGWVPRRDNPDIVVRENTDGTWSMFDGKGRTFRFAMVSPALEGTDLWLLQDVSGSGGTNVHLDYNIATAALPGGTGISIDLAQVSYNPSPTTASCYKNTVALTYDTNASAPLAISMGNGLPLARFHKLVSVDVYSKSIIHATTA